MISKRHSAYIQLWLSGINIDYCDKTDMRWYTVSNPSFREHIDYRKSMGTCTIKDYESDFNLITDSLNDNSFIGLKQRIIIDIAKGINVRFYLTQYQSSKFSVRCWNETHESTQKQIEQKKEFFCWLGNTEILKFDIFSKS